MNIASQERQTNHCLLTSSVPTWRYPCHEKVAPFGAGSKLFSMGDITFALSSFHTQSMTLPLECKLYYSTTTAELNPILNG